MRSTCNLLPLAVALGSVAAMAALPGTANAAESPPRPVASMVANLAPGPRGSDPQDLTAMNGTLFFTAGDGVHGRQLWKSDGTAAGTVMLTHVPGPRGAGPEDLTVADGVLFFSAWDPQHGRELWKSDGTAAGTTLVSDIVAGPVGSSPEDITYAVGQQNLPVQQVLVYFSGWDPKNGRQLWKSDGTASGTVMISGINPGPAAGLRPEGITAGPYTDAAFSGDDGTHGREPWYFSGTAGSAPQMTADLHPGPVGSNPHNFVTTVFHEGIFGAFEYTYFTADDGTHGREMFLLGTPPQVYDINPGSAPSDAGPFTEVINGTGLVSADDGTHGHELFAPSVRDPFAPTSLGVRLIADINPGTASSTPVLAPALSLIGYIDDTGFVPISTTRTYMSADDGTHGRELWEADEFITGGVGENQSLSFDVPAVRPVADIASGGRGSDPRDFTPVGGLPPFDANSAGTEVFTANDRVHGREVWVSGGWATNTAMAADINPGPEGSGPAGFTAIGQAAYFSANDGRHGRELWKLTLPAAPLTEVGFEGGKVPTASAVPFYVGILPGPGMPQPAGDVTFYQDGAPIGTVPLTSGYGGVMSASIMVTAEAGSHQIVGVYSGDGTYPSTTSSTMVYTGS